MKNFIYQPALSEAEWQTGALSSFEVYRQYSNAKDDFPTHAIVVYEEGDIEDPTYVDDEDQRTVNYIVDLPNIDGEWIEVDTFKTKKEATEFTQRRFGTDDKGYVCLISEIG